MLGEELVNLLLQCGVDGEPHVAAALRVDALQLGTIDVLDDASVGATQRPLGLSFDPTDSTLVTASQPAQLIAPPDRPCVSRQGPPDAALVRLENLVRHGEGFVVEYTAEYIEGAGPDICREVVRKLHQGEFSIQGYIDLHGFNVERAREAFDNFLKDSVASAKRGVLIVHGRGLSSPEEPVLKTKVFHWLTRGPWRKWVVAFCSARSCDGGAGATYVLLRRTPVTKKRRKKGMRAI